MNSRYDESIYDPRDTGPSPTNKWMPTRHFKGGGSSQSYYNNLELLYGEQAAMAGLLRETAASTVIPSYKRLVKSADEFDSIPNREAAAARAMNDATVSGERGLDSLLARMSSTGADVSDENMLRQIRAYKLAQAGNVASSGTQARDAREREGFARRLDVTGMGMGIPGQATAAYAGATNTANQTARTRLAENEQEASNWADMVQGGVNAYQIWKGKDGGYVSKRGLRMARGGFLNAGVTPMPPPAQPQRQQPTAGGVLTSGSAGYKTGAGLQKDIGKGIQWIGEQAGSPEMSQFGHGFEIGTTALRDEAVRNATAAVDKALGSAGTQAATDYGVTAGSQQATMLAAQDLSMTGALSPAAADAAVTTAAAGAPEAAGLVAGATEGAALAGGAEAAAAGTVASEAGLGAGAATLGATIGTAVPVIGAGLLIAAALGAFGKDGGLVTKKGIKRASGGPVDRNQFLKLFAQQNYPALIQAIKEEPEGLWNPKAVLGGPLRMLRRADGGGVGREPMYGGGEVDGPGGPTDDRIPAWLSDGEYVLNADAVRHFGLDKLDKMNQIGLEKRGLQR